MAVMGETPALDSGAARSCADETGAEQRARHPRCDVSGSGRLDSSRRARQAFRERDGTVPHRADVHLAPHNAEHVDRKLLGGENLTNFGGLHPEFSILSERWRTMMPTASL